MVEKKLRVVHYINQFYAQIGGEEAADVGISVREEAVGPGQLLNQLLGERGEVVRTVICGDNHIAENLEIVVPQVVVLVNEAEPDLFIAGPGFNAGRYGLACGAVTAAVYKQLKIPSVTGLYAENPGVDLYSGLAYIIGIHNSARRMGEDISKIVRFALKLVDSEPIGYGSEEGYLGTGPVRSVDYSVSGAKRAVNMALDKFYGRPFNTEVPMPQHELIPPSQLTKPLKKAKVALVSDGGLVPKGNPDQMVPVNSQKFGVYSITGKDSLAAEDYEVRHQGYNNAFVLENPNRLVPVDVLRRLEKEGLIGKLADRFYTTAGVMTSMENCKKFGQEIAALLREDQVDAVILTST